MNEAGKAVVLVSGGLDSATTLAVAGGQGFDCFAMSFDYGQRHRLELSAAERIAEALGCREHRIIKIDLAGIGGSALTTNAPVAKSRSRAEMAEHIPATYVPARNTIFLSCALAWAEVIGASDIFIGVNAVDYSGYPDCRPEYIQAFEHMANLATKSAVEAHTRVRIQAPLLYLSKPEIIRKGLALGLDYSLTHSCYDPLPDGVACGACDSCRIRRKGFYEAGMQDPIPYMAE